MIRFLNTEAFRPKVARCISKYLSLSEMQSLTVGFYKNGKWYVFGDGEKSLSLMYDIGSVSKTITAHLILSLAEQNLLDIEKSVDSYLELPKGNYPTIYELLTHTCGYGHLTPAKITVPALIKHGYARKNIYDGCTSKTVIKHLGLMKNRKKKGYSYSDFPYAVLAVVAEKVTGRNFADLYEDFVHNSLNMRDTVIDLSGKEREPIAVQGKRVLRYWEWKRENPYIAGGGLVSNVKDMLNYVALQIESELPYIASAHRICKESVSEKQNIAMCIGWHTYKKSNQLWHVGGVGTFRSSVILNKKRKIGVVVLGNSKGVASANVHYLAKMLYSEMKINKIRFDYKKDNTNTD